MNRWVIIATERARRPQPAEHPCYQPSGIDCPFCNGAEEETPHETLSFRLEGTRPNKPGWWVRVVPNKFPALQPSRVVWATSEDGLFEHLEGHGVHEVVVESPHHRQTIDELPVNQVTEVFWAIQHRMKHFSWQPGIVHAQVFKNHGREAGASLEHPHCQLLAMPVIPVLIEEELAGCQRARNLYGGCPFCRMIEAELEDARRIVAANDLFVAFCPYASRFPYETWIVPRRHREHFHELEADEVPALAALMQNVVQRITCGLGNPAYNYMLHTAPFRSLGAHFHWHIELFPRTTRVAGFEWGTGCYINPTPPEMAAAFLRDVEVHQVPARPLPHLPVLRVPAAQAPIARLS